MEENCGEYNGVKHSVQKDHGFARLMGLQVRKISTAVCGIARIQKADYSGSCIIVFLCECETMDVTFCDWLITSSKEVSD